MTKKRNIYLDSQGNRLPGVTTVLSCLAKDALIPWASKMACESVRGAWKPDISYTAEEIEQILDTAKAAHAVKKRDAGDLGTRVHEITGAYIDGQLKPEMLEDGKERTALQNFILVTEGWKWLAGEITVVHEELKYGGTADALAELPDGKIVIVDLKTSTHVFSSYDLQLAMYALASPNNEKLLEAWGRIAEGRIAHFHKDICSWEMLERDLRGQYAYVPAVRKTYEWKRHFDSQW